LCRIFCVRRASEPQLTVLPRSQAFEEDPSAAPLGVVKLTVDIVTKSTTCSLDSIRSILRKTLALLYGRQDLDVCVLVPSLCLFDEPEADAVPVARSSTMALWLRMLVYELVARRDLDQALEYVQNAAQLIERHKVRSFSLTSSLSSSSAC